jgi:hypothetical protein
MSQLRDGSRGRLSNSDGGTPVYSSAERRPDFGLGGPGAGAAAGAAAVVEGAGGVGVEAAAPAGGASGVGVLMSVA